MSAIVGRYFAPISAMQTSVFSGAGTLSRDWRRLFEP
jgi:hypothetical protein